MVLIPVRLYYALLPARAVKSAAISGDSVRRLLRHFSFAAPSCFSRRSRSRACFSPVPSFPPSLSPFLPVFVSFSSIPPLLREICLFLASGPPAGEQFSGDPRRWGRYAKSFCPLIVLFLRMATPAIRKKATAMPSPLIGAAKRHTKTILSSLFPIHCVKQPLSGTQENQGDFTISPSLKGGGRLWGEPLVPYHI